MYLLSSDHKTKNISPWLKCGHNVRIKKNLNRSLNDLFHQVQIDKTLLTYADNIKEGSKYEIIICSNLGARGLLMAHSTVLLKFCSYLLCPLAFSYGWTIFYI